MSHVHTWPQLIEDLKFNKSCPSLIFIWQDVISVGAPAPRQGLYPRPCSHHPPSGPLHLPASCSIPTQLSAEAPPPTPHPTVQLSCTPPLFPPVLLLSPRISRNPSRHKGQAACQPLVAWQLFSQSLIRIHHSFAFNLVFCCCCCFRNVVSPF